MAVNQLNQSQAELRAAERRAFERHSIQLPAICRHATLGEFSCEIRDFCIGGMYLICTDRAPERAQSQNGPISILCTIPTAAGEQRLSFQARIVRSDGHSCGVSFLNPDLTALQALQDYARQHPAPPQGQPPFDAAGEHTGTNSGAYPELFDECRKLLIDQVTPLALMFVERCTERLFNTVDQLKRAQEQNAYFSALSIFEKQGDVFVQAFKQDISSQLQQGDGTDRPAARAPEEMALTRGHLTLIEDEVFEDWLAVTDLIDHAESHNQEKLNALAQRLAVILEKQINHDNNPFAPSLFAHAFQEALKNLDLENVIFQACYSVFRQLLNSQLSSLYDKLNQYLIDHGILPEMEFFIPTTATDTSHNQAMSNAVPPPENRPPSAPEAYQQNSTGSEDTANPAGGYYNVPGGSGLPCGSAYAPSPSGPGAASAMAATTTNRPSQAKNLYQVVQDLKNLQNHLHDSRPAISDHAAVAAPPPVATLPAGSAQQNPGIATEMNMPRYDTEEIIHVLSDLQHETTNATDKAHAHDYKERIMPLLMARHEGDETRQIGIREQGIMDVAGNIFDSLRQDMLIANNVRSWLKRLEIPLLKQALLDDSLFLDKNHVARQVVNKISQLELYGSDNSHSGQNAIHKKINMLLDRVTGEEDPQIEVFSKVLKELDLLIQTQNDAYQANLGDLANACEQEQQLLEAMAINGGNPPPNISGQLHYLSAAGNNLPGPALDDSEESWQQWIVRVHRLQIGNWLLFSNKATDSQRLRLAWITKKRDRYVFVNLRGLREITLSDEVLALRLQTGKAVVLDNADEPALDRAQYTMLQNLHQQLLHETTHDQLTGLINRRDFERCLKENLHQGSKNEQQHTLGYLDINQFGLINETCGYEAGDCLLVEVAQRLSNCVDAQTTLARLGGDDFGILFHNSSIENSNRQMQALLDGMTNFHFQHGDTHYPVTLNIGLVPLESDNSSATELIRHGETCCNLARKKGSNRIHIYDRDDQSVSRQQQTIHWLNRVDTALENNTLALRYQPIVPILEDGYGAPHHSEILLGVTDDEGNPVSPEAFILAAERYNRMPTIDRWVIRHAFQWIVTHTDKLDTLGGCAINLSGNSLNDEDFKAFILEEIRTTGVPTERICFEVTETAGIDNLSSAATFILAIKETGCSFSLDDFGSGMSSYGYLKNLPVDFLKIDGAFVRELDKNPEDYAVVKSITEIGHFMGKKIIAEYVESEAILEKLREIGVDYAQGYIIDKPQPLTDISRFCP